MAKPAHNMTQQETTVILYENNHRAYHVVAPDMEVAMTIVGAHLYPEKYNLDKVIHS